MYSAFDKTLRFLAESDPAAWVKLLKLKADSVELRNADFSTAIRADLLLLIANAQPEALHIELQVSYDAGLGERALQYCVLGKRALKVPIRSVVILLRPEADGPAMNGILKEKLPDGTLYLEFRFQVLRIWQMPPEDLLSCGLGVLPLAFVSAIGETELPELVRRAESALQAESEGRRAEIWTAVDILMGLKHPADFVATLLKGVHKMKESSTYQAILKEGEARGEARGKALGERQLILSMGRVRFGNPNAEVLRALDALDSLEKLEALSQRMFVVSSWQELFA